MLKVSLGEAEVVSAEAFSNRMCRPLYSDEQSVTVDYFSKMTGTCHFDDTTTLSIRLLMHQ
jgi:hypothetical protein